MQLKRTNRLSAQFLLLLCFGGMAERNANAIEAATVVIDQRAALEIGSSRVSHYLVEKYYRRFSDDLYQQMRRFPNEEERKAWFDLFVAKQILITHAESLGYFSRPEVVDITARMERHMLTQPTGPFYQHLFEQQPAITEAKLREIYAQSFATVDGVFARYCDVIMAKASLGADFDECPIAEQFRRIQQSQERREVQVADGNLAWPFQPFIEIAGVIGSAPIGRWIKHQEPGAGVYYIYIRGVQTNAIGDFTEDRKRFEILAQQIRQTTIQNRRRQELLFSTAFSLSKSIADQLAKLCHDLATSEGKIPEVSVQPLAEKQLFTYELGSKTIVVSVEDYRRHFNGGFIRKLPRTLVEVQRSAEDMAMEQLDYADAKSQGIDCMPQFMEDRRGFAGFQVLDLYEREVLKPKIEPNSADIEHYYSTHPHEYSRIGRARGRLVEFESMGSAVEWIRVQRLPASDIRSKIPSSPSTDSQLEISSEQVISGFGNWHEAFLNCPEGLTIGPIRFGDKFVLFRKEQNLSTSLISLAEVTPAIRRILVRQALDVVTLSIAAELTKAFKIENRIEYSRYGLSDARTLRPTRF